jgi:phosphatidylglycerol:prolipoprotein diacylglycerol transferase
MVFPYVDHLPRHPSMLYELFLEGILFFVIMWLYSSKPRPTMAVSGLYLVCYGVFRFGVEFVRVPDAHIGFLAFDWLTMGHLLSLPMIIIGVIFFTYAMRRTDGKVSW